MRRLRRVAGGQRVTPLHSHYKLWETKLMSSRKSLQNKMPEIRRALDAVIFLEKKQVGGASACPTRSPPVCGGRERMRPSASL